MTTKILVLGDHFLIELVQGLLQDSDYSIQGTESESEAISLLDTKQYDLLILTNSLADGKPSTDFLTEWRLHNNENLSYPLVLFLEARTDTFLGFIRGPVHPHQAHAYMPIPAPAEEFFKWIEALLEEKRY